MENQKIPFRYYLGYILLSIVFIICILFIKYDLLDFKKDNENYDLPFIQVLNTGEQIVRIYPSVSPEKIIPDDDLDFHTLKSLVGQNLNYRDLSGFNFGRIDHHVNDGVYEIFDIFGNSIAIIYEKQGIISGFTYKYIVEQTTNQDPQSAQHWDQVAAKLQTFIQNNFYLEITSSSKNFIANYDNNIYVISIKADMVSYDTISDIIKFNDKFSIDISVFQNIQAYENYVATGRS